MTPETVPVESALHVPSTVKMLEVTMAPAASWMTDVSGDFWDSETSP